MYFIMQGHFIWKLHINVQLEEKYLFFSFKYNKGFKCSLMMQQEIGYLLAQIKQWKHQNNV